MDAELIIKLIIALAAILAVLIFFLFLEPKEDTPMQSEPLKKSPPKSDLQPQKTKKEEPSALTKPTLDSLVDIVKNKRSDSKKLSETLSLIIEHYGVIGKKMGIRPHKDFDIYMDVLFSICRHPHTTKDIILDFDKELERLNPEYKKEINEAISKGLYSRGA